MLRKFFYQLWLKFAYPKWINSLVKQQDYLLKYFFIMNSNVYFFKKPCDKCKCYVEAGDIVREYQDQCKPNERKF